MSKIASMLKVFKREKKSQGSVEGGSSRSNKSRRSVLDADSFVFMPGDSGAGVTYWGEIINDSHCDDTRRKSNLGLESGIQEVNLLIRNRLDASDKDEKFFLNGNVFNRRYSETRAKGFPGETRMVDADSPVLRDYAFLLSAKEKNDVPGRYAYDRLIRAPLQSAGSLSHSQQKRLTLVADSQSRGDRDFKKTDMKANNASSKYARDDRERHFMKMNLKANSGPPKYGRDGSRVPDEQICDTLGKHRPASMYSGHSNYAGLEWNRSKALPGNAVSWELNLEDPDQYEAMPMKMYRTIAPQDLFLRDKIGEGQFGDVHNGFLCPKTPDEKEVAIKTCKEDASIEDRAKFLEEALVMCKFKHPNIIRLYGVVSHMDLAYIVMELAPHGQLRRYLLVEGMRISRIMLLHYISQLSSAMVHLEDMNYVHRDIAARNILVCNHRTIKLADFGLSRVLEDGDYYVASRGKLPIKWMAPESINFRRFTGLSDVWMFGVCCWEILMRGVKPFVGIKNDEVISKIEIGDRLPLPVECPPALFSLMNVCWNYDPLDRPRFIEIEAKTLDIIEEENKIGEIDSRWCDQDASENPISPIQRDPDAPTKPVRQYPSVDRLEENGVPPLPPRAMERFRELSNSPPLIDGGSINQLINTNIPPPRGLQMVHSNDQLRGLTIAEGLPNSPISSPRIIPPYSITTINPPRTQVESPPPSHLQQHPHQPSTHVHDNSSQGNQALNSHVPPPAILAQHPSHLQQQQQQSSSSGQRGDPDPDTGIYYSTAQDVMPDKKQQRMLNKDGIFVSREMSSMREGIGGVRPRIVEDRSISHASTEGSSGRSSPAVSSDERRYSPRQRTSGGDVEQAHTTYVMQDEDDILKHTTGVVKSVKELSDQIHKCKPSDYRDLVKNVGLALRDLLGKVDIVVGEIPSEIHNEVLMAQKVLSSDMNQLVSAMKDAQSHYDRFLEQEYQKKMLKAAHVVAVNSKLLLDAVNSARQKASFMK